MNTAHEYYKEVSSGKWLSWEIEKYTIDSDAEKEKNFGYNYNSNFIKFPLLNQ